MPMLEFFFRPFLQSGVSVSDGRRGAGTLRSIFFNTTSSATVFFLAELPVSGLPAAGRNSARFKAGSSSPTLESFSNMHTEIFP